MEGSVFETMAANDNTPPREEGDGQAPSSRLDAEDRFYFAPTHPDALAVPGGPQAPYESIG